MIEDNKKNRIQQTKDENLLPSTTKLSHSRSIEASAAAGGGSGGKDSTRAFLHGCLTPHTHKRIILVRFMC